LSELEIGRTYYTENGDVRLYRCSQSTIDFVFGKNLSPQRSPKKKFTSMPIQTQQRPMQGTPKGKGGPGRGLASLGVPTSSPNTPKSAFGKSGNVISRTHNVQHKKEFFENRHGRNSIQDENINQINKSPTAKRLYSPNKNDVPSPKRAKTGHSTDFTPVDLDVIKGSPSKRLLVEVPILIPISQMLFLLFN